MGGGGGGEKDNSHFMWGEGGGRELYKNQSGKSAKKSKRFNTFDFLEQFFAQEMFVCGWGLYLGMVKKLKIA